MTSYEPVINVTPKIVSAAYAHEAISIPASQRGTHPNSGRFIHLPAGVHQIMIDWAGAIPLILRSSDDASMTVFRQLKEIPANSGTTVATTVISSDLGGYLSMYPKTLPTEAQLAPPAVTSVGVRIILGEARGREVS